MSATPSVEIAQPRQDEAQHEEPEPPTAERAGRFLPVLREGRTGYALGRDCLGEAPQPEVISEIRDVRGASFELAVVHSSDTCNDAATPVDLGLSPAQGAPVRRRCQAWRLSKCMSQEAELALPLELGARVFNTGWEWPNALRSLREQADGLGEAPPDPDKLFVKLEDGVSVGYQKTTTVLRLGSGVSLDLGARVGLFVKVSGVLHAVTISFELDRTTHGVPVMNRRLDVFTITNGKPGPTTNRSVPRFPLKETDFPERDQN